MFIYRLKRVLRYMTILLIAALLGFSARIGYLAKESQQMHFASHNPALRFTPCSVKPNCVSSFAQDEEHKVESIDLALTLTEIKDAILKLPGYKLILEDLDYLHFEHEVGALHFVDDLEVKLDAKGIHFKSASRVGYSDLGANRKSIEQVKKQLQKKAQR